MKRAVEVKQKAFVITFKGLSAVKNCLRPESALLRIPSVNVTKSVGGFGHIY